MCVIECELRDSNLSLLISFLLVEKCDALNLFFSFRWLLIWFKREFEWVDIMRLWEVLFSDHLSTQFQLFVAMAIVDKHRDVMIDHLKGFDEILKVNTPTLPYPCPTNPYHHTLFPAFHCVPRMHFFFFLTNQPA